MSRSVIWVNITTSYHWQRPAVGIIRVESEIARYLPEVTNEKMVKYCIWQRDRFVEVTAPRADKTADKASPPPSPRADAYQSPLSRTQAIKQIALGILSLFPRRLHAPLRGFLLNLNHWRHQLQSRLRPTLTRCHTPAISRAKTPEIIEPARSEIFEPGDVLLTVGLDWNYPYRPEIKRLRLQKGLRVVSCCYDLIPVIYPQLCVNDVADSFSAYFMDMARLSDLMLCISARTQHDLIMHLHETGAPIPATEVFRLGDNIQQHIPDTVEDDALATLIDKPFILFVSTIERRKNHQVLYQAYHLLASQGYTSQLPQLLFVGMPGWGTDELRQDLNLDLLVREKITCCHHVSDADLAVLYQRARFTVFPSLYEGWGLPVAESLAYGTPVISADSGSLPEVGADWVQYCDPWSPREWANAILHWSRDDIGLQQWRNRLQQFYQPQHWRDTAVDIAGKIQRHCTSTPAARHIQPAYDMSSQAGYPAGATWVSEEPTDPLLVSRALCLSPATYQLTIQGQSPVSQSITVAILTERYPLATRTINWQSEDSQQTIEFCLEEITMVRIRVGHQGRLLTLRALSLDPVIS